MKRILVVDDERHVTEGISSIVKRYLKDEFEVCGSAQSGREAIVKTTALAPDVVLIDVQMPGISGLDVIREMRRRGSLAAFILVTAYERFDIAREAMELGVLDYLLKPVAKDKLGASLRAAAEFLDRRGEQEMREIDSREREERLRIFVEAAFLHGIMLGERFGPDLERYRAALGIQDGAAVVAAAAFLPPLGCPDPDAEMRRLHEQFRATVRYKTKAFAGPLGSGHALVLLPLADPAGGREAVEGLKGILAKAHPEDLAKGYLRLGFGAPRALPEAGASWTEALGDLLGRRRTGAGAKPAEGGKPFEDDDAFLEALLGGSPERAWLALERLLEPLRSLAELPQPERYRIISVFGSAYRLLARRGLLAAADAYAMMDFEDLRAAGAGPAFDLGARARFSQLTGIMERTPRWSPTVARAIGFVKENFGSQISLEQAAYAVGLSPNRLSRIFSEETGNGFSDFLIEFRIERAKEMLAVPGASIKQVSVSCGYPDPNYFSRLFKKVTGLTPTAFSSGGPEANDGK